MLVFLTKVVYCFRSLPSSLTFYFLPVVASSAISISVAFTKKIKDSTATSS
jgi:hypothetical protein